jgi:beta-glucosidase
MEKADYKIYHNANGPDIGSANDKVICQDGHYFRDLAGTGELLPYEDWRLSAEERAKDLAARLSVEEIAGLMLYSPHQMVPALSQGPFVGTYNGKTLEESGVEKWALTDQQKTFLIKDHVRHVLALKLENAEIAAKWNNNMQQLAESLPWGIPVNFSSDPRHGAAEAGAEFKSGGKDVSKWPEGLGIAATFSPEICRAFGEAVSTEYRALGIATALHPQVDLATEPRWMRFEDTFGTNPQQVTELGKIFCDSLQTTEGEPEGWGKNSVCGMAKHWPGGGPCEGGRDAHYAFGKYAVYPGQRFKDHLKPFTEGVFQLNGPTKKVASIMPYYTVSWNRDEKNGKNVGNSYSEYLIHDLLRETYGFDGVVCTDWGITGDPAPVMDSFGSRCFGVEDLTVAQRHLLAIENGVDQFGGNSEMQPILDAYRLGCEKHGEEAMRQRMERSAVRLLKNIFRCGLFENPYLDPEESKAVVGCEAFVKAGYEAQLKSVVMAKNQEVLPVSERKKVYIPNRTIRARKNFFRGMDPERHITPVEKELVEQYYDWAETPEEADFALVFVESPLSDGYSEEDAKNGGNGYLPVSLQYRPYTAVSAREESIAGGDIREDFTNRSYRGKTGITANESDLDILLDTKKAMEDKPVILCMRVHNPAVMQEMEPYADAILFDFGVQKQAILDLVSGKAEPSGLLPVEFPASMETVEQHCEDAPFDMEVYQDEDGHGYSYGFGMNWSGVIHDSRVERYTKTQ